MGTKIIQLRIADKFCPKGHKGSFFFPAGDFCPKCGSALKKGNDVKILACDACSKMVSDIWEHCIWCGNKLQ